MLELLKTINSDYAGVLSLLSSLGMVIVTIIYVGHTKRQANYAKESAELVVKQIKTDKQPCVVPHVADSFGSAWKCTDLTRMQLGFTIKLKNVGDSPAINIYTLTDIELQFTKNSEGNKKMLSATLLPGFIQALSADEETEINVHFETAEIKTLICELKETAEKNWERLRTNPNHNHYNGANLIIRVFFKNIMGQWYESTISYEIAWLAYKNPPPQKTHNLNENIIPPKEIHEGDEFKAILTSHYIAPFVFAMTTEERVFDLLQKYIDESPWLSTVLKENQDHSHQAITM